MTSAIESERSVMVGVTLNEAENHGEMGQQETESKRTAIWSITVL